MAACVIVASVVLIITAKRRPKHAPSPHVLLAFPQRRKNIEVAVIALNRDLTFVNSVGDGAGRLVVVRAVGEAAVADEGTHFDEVAA